MGVREEKEQLVQQIAEKLQNSKSTIVTDYRGLNVAQVTELRKQLRDNNVEFKVLKNTLTRLATQKTDYTGLDDVLVGPTAIAFGEEDAVTAAKVLVDFAKKNDKLEIKGGIVEGQVVSIEEIKALASLPSREGLISMFLSVLQAPMRNFALAVKAVAEKNEEEGQQA
ncbi:50S ribosomal protein L10 [Desulfuribacillus alkaliarsenatis]|uniref:Large ribosomal subunit protein uL10 n=1 Tax=Desulfuribacillus alkaliarsenatis TaxID=766136 RepID=A0A1E5G5I1_9FIRM|nr:50S ribosomal protein L10 [Desulfuribacillus alkaliarsenatis]OEF97949.1 50S ribosomal protein L10 [Desulfuribacillus alkaliarsenatis]